MSKEIGAPEEDSQQEGAIEQDLVAFLDRCIRLGMTSLTDLRGIIDDDHLCSRISAAESHNPLEGAQADAESLARELKEQAIFVANIVGSRAETEEEEND